MTDETWEPYGAFMIHIGDEHFLAVDRTGNRWREYPHDYTTVLRDRIIEDHRLVDRYAEALEQQKEKAEARGWWSYAKGIDFALALARPEALSQAATPEVK